LISGGSALAQSGPQNLTLEVTHLAPLDEAMEGHHEGWAIVGGRPSAPGSSISMGTAYPSTWAAATFPMGTARLFDGSAPAEAASWGAIKALYR